MLVEWYPRNNMCRKTRAGQRLKDKITEFVGKT